MTAEIKTIGVIGAGQMGSGIAQVCAMVGFQVWLYDIAQSQLTKAKEGIEKSLAKFVQKGKLAEAQKSAAMQSLHCTSSLADFRDCDFCIETATEKKELKEYLFHELGHVTKEHCILASNTSSIPIASLAVCTVHPDRVIGMHFMNPVPLMECVEVIQGRQTSAETLQATLTLAKKLGKTPVTVKDAPGFVVNRILMPLINEAVLALEEGLATKEDIDLAMKISCNFPMGPLTLADFIGLDTCVAIMEVMKKRPSPLLQKLVKEGKFGRKSGEGFYKY